MLQSNAVELYLPNVLYVADIVKEAQSRTRFGSRKAVREYAKKIGNVLPSGFEVHANQLVTFHRLDEPTSPFGPLLELGTVTTMRPSEFYELDENYLRVFKSLLRLVMQQKLFDHRVQWMHEDELFAFMPLHEGENVREVTWRGEKEATRKVFERKANKKDATKDFVVKHLAFRLEFFLIDGAWFMAITPDWYFSFGRDYARSRYSNEHLSWIKRAENNAQVMTHFRFIATWLKNLDNEDLFAEKKVAPTLSIGEPMVFSGHPDLNDDQWRPTPEMQGGGDDQSARLI